MSTNPEILAISARYGKDVALPVESGDRIPDQQEIVNYTRICLASKSRVKLDPLQDWHDKQFGKGKFTIEGIDTPSNVPNQPIGMQQTIEGMLNRLAFVISERPGAFGYISVESGILGEEEEQPWEDRAVMGAIIGGQKFSGISSGVFLPEYYVDIIKKANGAITWGDIEYAAQLRAGIPATDLDPQDPQKTITGGEYPRRTQLYHLFDRLLIKLIPIVYNPTLRSREITETS